MVHSDAEFVDEYYRIVHMHENDELDEKSVTFLRNLGFTDDEIFQMGKDEDEDEDDYDSYEETD